MSVESALTDGWCKVKFGDVVREVRETEREPLASGFERYVGLEHLDPDTLHISRWGLIAEDSTTFTKVFRKGQMLFGRRRAYLRKAAVADFDGICSGDIIVMKAKPTHLLPDLLPFIVQSEGFFDFAIHTSAGSLSPRTKWTHLASYEFALPPMDEQRRIAEMLWAAEETINRYSTSLSSFETTQNVFLAHVLSEGMNSSSSYITSKKLGRIPKNWQEATINDVADVNYGLTVNKVRRTHETQLPYLRVANVARGFIDLSEIKTIGVVDDDIERFGLIPKDVLVVEGHANVDEIGRAAIWEGEIETCLHQNHIIRIRCGEQVHPYYLLSYLNSPRGKAYFRQRAQSTSGLNTINSTTIKRMPVPLPPYPEQSLIVERFYELADVYQSMEQNLQSVRLLKRQLLSRLIGTEMDQANV